MDTTTTPPRIPLTFAVASIHAELADLRRLDCTDEVKARLDRIEELLAAIDEHAAE